MYARDHYTRDRALWYDKLKHCWEWVSVMKPMKNWLKILPDILFIIENSQLEVWAMEVLKSNILKYKIYTTINRLVLECFLEKLGWRVWVGFVCSGLGPVAGSCVHSNEPLSWICGSYDGEQEDGCLPSCNTMWCGRSY